MPAPIAVVRCWRFTSPHSTPTAVITDIENLIKTEPSPLIVRGRVRVIAPVVRESIKEGGVSVARRLSGNASGPDAAAQPLHLPSCARDGSAVVASIEAPAV